MKKLVTYQLGEQRQSSSHSYLPIIFSFISFHSYPQSVIDEREYLKMNWWKIRYLYLRSDFYSKLIILLEIQWCRRTLKEMNIFMYNYFATGYLIYVCVSVRVFDDIFIYCSSTILYCIVLHLQVMRNLIP